MNLEKQKRLIKDDPKISRPWRNIWMLFKNQLGGGAGRVETG